MLIEDLRVTIGGERGRNLTNSFIRKLDSFETLNAADREWLLTLSRETSEVAANESLIREGEDPRCVHVILEGLAARCKTTLEGRRQILPICSLATAATCRLLS
jgi:hypothetical protein